MPFVNIPFFRRLIIMFSTMLNLIPWLRQTRQVPDRLIAAYAMYTPTLAAAVAICRWFRVPCVLLVPDLPEFFRPGYVASPLVRWIRKANLWIVYRLAEQMQGFVFLTKHMAERFRIDGKPVGVVEGCVDVEGEKDIPVRTPGERPRERIVMYAGILAAAYGVRMLVRAFMLLEESRLSSLALRAGRA